MKRLSFEKQLDLAKTKPDLEALIRGLSKIIENRKANGWTTKASEELLEEANKKLLTL